MNERELKSFLDLKYEQFNSPDFIKSDPIQIPHRFKKKQDIEIIGLLTAIIAWGNRKSIIKSGEKLLELMEHAPHEYLLKTDSQDILKLHFVHRTFQSEDLHNFLISLKNYYQSNESLEKLFIAPTSTNMENRIIHFKKTLGECFLNSRTHKHLANPQKGSSAKRINMFLRWMVRKDKKGVDFGLWSQIPASILHLPLDVHTGNVARKLGLLKRNQNDWKAVVEITEVLKKFDPKDPCKYDFALFGLGAFEKF